MTRHIKMQTWLKTSYRHDPKSWESRLFLSNICWKNSLYLSVDLFWHLRPNFPGFSFFSSSFLPVFPVSLLSHLAVIADAHRCPFFLPVTVEAGSRAWLDKYQMKLICARNVYLCWWQPTRYCTMIFWKKTWKCEWLQNQLSFAACNVEPLRVLKFQLNFWVWRKLSL